MPAARPACAPPSPSSQDVGGEMVNKLLAVWAICSAWGALLIMATTHDHMNASFVALVSIAFGSIYWPED